MKTFAKIIAAALVVVLALFMFTGCGAKKTDKDSDTLIEEQQVPGSDSALKGAAGKAQAAANKVAAAAKQQASSAANTAKDTVAQSGATSNSHTNACSTVHNAMDTLKNDGSNP